MNTFPSDVRSPSDHVLDNPWFQIVLVTLLAIVLIFSKLGGNGLANYDDCFYAEKAKEILKTGELMTMRYAGAPAYENPPFYMWLVALSYLLFGVTEYAAKFPSALFGVGTVVLLYFLVRRLFSPWVAFCSAVVLSTTFIFVRYARHAMLDVTLTFFVSLAMLALVLATRKNPRYFLLFGLSVGVCVLTKSVLGFFPLVIAVLFLGLTGRWRLLFNVYFLAGVAVAFLIGCSWYVHQTITYGDVFLRAHFGWVILQRGFTEDPSPWYEHLSYFRDLLTNYWPWLPVLCFGLWRYFTLAFRKDDTALLFVLWFSVIIVTMSVMNARVLWYIMPVFPAAAVMSGDVLASLLRNRGRLVFVSVVVGIGIFAALLINMTPLQVEPQRERDVRILAPYVRQCATEGATIAAYRFTYHGLNSALQFYSDHAAARFYDNPADLRTAFKGAGLMVCIIRASDHVEVFANAPGCFVIRSAEEYMLVANRPVDVSGVKTW